MDNSYIKEEKAVCDFTNAPTAEENSRKINAQESATTAHAVAAYESILTKPTDNTMSSDNPSEDTQPIQKPSLSYIALISKVILSSPLQKLNLASIYRAMEEQFPYLRSRGPGWRNSVRHNLSVNDCFVKVSRCEDGRGHYWGVSQAYLRDFQQGNFRQYRKARERRERELYDKMTWCQVCMEGSCFLGRFCESRSLSWMKPHCTLLEPQRYKMSSFDWTETHYKPWSANVGCIQPPNWITQYYFPEHRPYGSLVLATARRGDNSQHLTSRLHSCYNIGALVKGIKESNDSRFMTPQVQPLFTDCWCMSPTIKELIKTLPYTVNLNFSPELSSGIIMNSRTK